MMKKADIIKLVRPNIRSLKAYEAKEIPCRVKLDANEGPYSPLPASKALADKAILSSLNRYPDPEGKALKSALARSIGVSSKNILLGNGSDEIIYYLISVLGGPVLFPVPTFVMYGVISQTLGAKAIPVPLDKNFDLDTGKIVPIIKKQKPKLIFLSSPNNPTGNCFSYDRILKIIRASKGIVVVDEAYHPFACRSSFLPSLKEYPNLAVLRTMSKVGFAALRVGYMVAAEELIREVNKVRLPYNLNSISQAVALQGLKDKKIIRALALAVSRERSRLMTEMSAMDGATPFPSEANFILFRVGDADGIYRELLKQGVLIKNLNRMISNAMRVTIGTRRENDIFLKALKRAIKSAKRKV
jgi:histidinol-phosphate aminotransferase